MARAIFICLILLCSWYTSAQQFVCDGEFYLVISPETIDGNLYRLSFSNNTDSITFDRLPSPTRIYINAMGFRHTDRYIYGINPPTRDLYKINALGDASFLTSLPGLNAGAVYVAGSEREGEAKEVADLVGYLASDEASFISGANIDINGGLAFS